jgi:RNA polymerase sigma-70 factor (ECF subfamily)
LSKTVSFLDFTQGHLQSLVDASRAGDQQAFAQLSGIVSDIAEEYFHSKYRIGKIRSLQDAEDLTQNVYLTFTEQFVKIERIENWLRKVLFYTFINYYKKNRASLFYDDERALRRKAASENVEDTLDVQQILSVVNKLSEEKQLVIKLRFWDGMKFADIAGLMGKTSDAVKKIFYRSIIEIKRHL